MFHCNSDVLFHLPLWVFYLGILGGPYLALLKDYTWLSPQELFLVSSEDHVGCLKSSLGSPMPIKCPSCSTISPTAHFETFKALSFILWSLILETLYKKDNTIFYQLFLLLFWQIECTVRLMMSFFCWELEHQILFPSLSNISVALSYLFPIQDRLIVSYSWLEIF